MLLTWSASLIGLSTLTVIGTVLPFSTMGGRSSRTLPWRTTASPTSSRIAALIAAGVACASRIATGRTPPAATMVPPAPSRKSRRFRLNFSIGRCIDSVSQGLQESYHIFDLLGRQDRLVAEGRRHPAEALRAVIGRHDRV